MVGGGGGGGAVAGGAGGVFLTTILGKSLFGKNINDQLILPSMSVNLDDSILSEWFSESLDSDTQDPLENECNFFNFSHLYKSDFCDAFTLSRIQPATISKARVRALKCAAFGNTECILSHEIGLAVPVAFLARHDHPDGMKVLIGPRNLTVNEDDPKPKKVHVRVREPSDAFNSRTVPFNDSVRVEFLSMSRSIKNELFVNADAFCLQLLRDSYENECWNRLDGV